MQIPLYVICCFSLAAFYIFSLYLTFVNLINHVLYFSAWVYPVWDSAFPELGCYFPSHFRRFSTISSPDIFSDPFSFSSSSGIPLSHMLVHLMYWRSLRPFSFFFILFSLFCSIVVISTTLFSSLLTYFLPHLFCFFYSFQCNFHFSFCILQLCLAVLIFLALC